MWSIFQKIYDKIFGKPKIEMPENPKTNTTKSPDWEQNIIKQKREITKKQKPIEIEKKEEKPQEVKTKSIKEPKKSIKTQEKLPIESIFEIKEPNIEVIKPIKKESKSSISPTKDNLSWKDQANAAEKIKRAFQGFFYDVASLENVNDLEIKKNSFENYKNVFKTKLEQNLSKLDTLDQQILKHISSSLLNKDIKDITETMEKQTMEQINKLPDKYIS